MRPQHRLLIAAAVVAAAVASEACLVVSLEPAYDNASIVFDEGLLGSWEAADGGTAVVERGEWHAYRITYSIRKESHALVGYETKIGERTLIDLAPARGLEAGPLMLPAHAVAIIDRTGDSLSFAPLDYDRLTSDEGKRLLRKLQYAFESRKNLVIVSNTGEWRAWLLAHIRDAQIFREPIAFTRKQQ